MTLFSQSVPFYKMHGCGNDFIIIDNRDLNLHPTIMGRWAKKLCQRAFGIHADGLFFLDTPPENSPLAYVWHFFNSDGSPGEMCGNAARCAARLAHAIGMAPADHIFGTLAGEIRATVMEQGPHAGEVRVQLPHPSHIDLNISLDINGESIKSHAVVVGVPHVVVFVDDVDVIDVCHIGSRIRYHDYFAPSGANVNFAQIKDRHSIRIRTYERGVEDETFACGTGAAATQFLSHRLNYTEDRAILMTTKGLNLAIDINEGSPYLQGPAELVFKGEFYPLTLGL